MVEKQMTEAESLSLIANMIKSAKGHFHESGNSSILWGTIIGVCGLLGFAQQYFKFSLGFDIWILTLVALIPQIIITNREAKHKAVVTHIESAINAVWLVYGLAVFALIAYFNIVGGVSDKIMAEQGIQIIRHDLINHTTEPMHLFPLSSISLLILLFGMPTLITGIVRKYKPMLIGGILCWVFYFWSLFTVNMYDNLFAGLAGISSWLIPGLLLRAKFNKQKLAHV